MFQGTGFGAGTSNTFGAFNKPATTFGATPTVFGSSGGSLFGSTAQPATGGLFGTTTPAPAFGQPQTTTPSFGGFSNNAGTGLFGNNQNASTSTGLFGSTTTSAFGQAKPAFGGFGTTQTTSLFGQQSTAQTQPQSANIFGQTNASSTGLFTASAGGFGNAMGATTNTGTGTVKFVAVTGSDTMIKNGVSQTISTRHHCITCMKEYEGKSLEELRMEDYTANRKGPQQGVQPSGLFGSTAQPSLFGTGANTSATPGTGLFGATENKPLFGNTNTSIGFGQSSNVFGSTGNSLFGKTTAATPAFGAPTTTNTNTFAFNSATNANPFGSNMAQVKPFGSTQSNLFGTSTSQPTTGFGTQTSAFGSAFGTPSTQSTSGGLFSQNKPTFGTNSNQFSFGQTSTTSAGTSLFGAKPTTTFGSPFGATTSNTTNAFGNTSSFGATNQNTSLFGSTFKSPTTNFSFGPTSTTNATLGGGSSLFGNTANKPPTVFGGGTTGTGLFGSSGNTNFGNTTFGSSANTGMGMSMPMGSLLGGSTFSSSVSSSNQQAANPLNQHILALASMPFGDNPLFKKLLPSTGKAEELLKPPPGLAQKNLTNSRNFKVSINNTAKIKMKPIIGAPPQTKMSLFEGLEDDPSYFQKMQMKPNIKRLNIQCRGARSPGGTKPSPEFTVNPLLPLENLGSEGSSPRYFTPLREDKDKATTPTPTSPADNTQLNTSSSEQTASVSISKAPSSSDQNDGTNTVLMNTLLSPENTMAELISKQAPSPGNTSLDNKENLEQSSSSNSSESDGNEVGGEPHPTGIVLRRVGYFTIPSMDQLAILMEQEGRCVVDNFTVGRYNYGNIFFPESFDVQGLNLDEIVHFRHKEVTVYPDENTKPPLGEGLNRPAQVTLDRVWPMDRKVGEPISDPALLDDMDYEGTLRTACAKMNARFKEYRPQTGSWVFKVDHFSKYGLSDSDEDEKPVSDIKKLRLNSAPPPMFPPGPNELGLKRGLDGAWGPPSQISASTTPLPLAEDDQDMDDELIKTPFDLDENYQPKHTSPTTQLARQMGASAQKVQLMKASFYTDEVDDCHLNGDFIDYRMGSMLDIEEFDQGPKLRKSFPIFRTQFNKYEDIPSPVSFQQVDVEMDGSLHAMPPQPVVETPLVPPMPPVKPEYKTLSCSDRAVISFAKSLAAQTPRCAADIALFKGHSFRVGWGIDNTLVSLSTEAVASTMDWTLPIDQLATVLEGRREADSSAAIVQRIRILPGYSDSGTSHFQASIEEHLETALEHSLFVEGEGCPRAGPRAGVDALHAHCALAQRAALANPHSFQLTFCQVWELCVALWGNLPHLDAHEPPGSHHSVMERRQAVSDWLETVVRDKLWKQMTTDTNSPANILSLLTGHCVMEACDHAYDAGDHYATLLLSQLGGDGSVRVMVDQQLTQWADTEADQLIDEDRIKLMMLVAGRPLFNASHRIINVCDKLDWRRAFAIHLWYICSPVASVTDALLRYDAAFSNEEQPYAASPLPTYCEDLTWETDRGQPIYDVCYHLLKLFSIRSYPLAPLLNPATHSADPLDHRLSWLLLRSIEALGYSHVSALSAASIHSMFAAQLVAHGLWHWAIFVLLHIADPQVRTKAVLETLGRHVDLSTDAEREAFLIEKIKIPAQWVFQAKATFATAHFRYKEAATFLLKAEQWNEAHNIIVQHISAKAIINEDYLYLRNLLEQIAPHSKMVSGWAHQGSLLLDYLSVVVQVTNLVAQQDPTVGYHLERLQPQLSSLCSRIHLLPAPTALHRMCQVEIAKRAVHMIRTLLILQRGDSAQSLGMSVSVLAHLVNQLPLPEDYSKQELRELITNMVTNVVR